ncbi:MAG: hypothetical protein GEV28_26810 [Actinophytocola sp.]|uniref:hypothetical protein n=1 Tax=Actinophytocola sp. TaxID=1872138 RepID=UPI001323098B|nr:hypothetical protein [Actinophytocola sp.]MPZ83807.1 hypothetical protein [Actinophytocola sp.]
MAPPSLTTTRRSLHGVAELILAGPQYRRSADIRLRVTEGGFATIAKPDLRLDGMHLVTGDVRVELDGRTYADVAYAVAVDVGDPAGVYDEGSGVKPDELITLDPEATRTITDALLAGDVALRGFAPEEDQVLWPEHLDVGITLGDVNYGVSPGDQLIPEPYAYVGPHEPRPGAFWNAPFGAAHPTRELGDAAAILRFFRAGRAHASR